ncbi:MAG: HlyU family transcriptional regulator [Pseudomonadota bacterium]
MSLFSKLFGGGTGSEKGPEPELHEGYRIFAEPAKDAGGFRIGARIELDVEGETKVHQMIRADVCPSAEEAMRVSLLKAKALIDQQGESIFR